MTNPILSDRVSPSGPLSGEGNGGLFPPASQIAGDFYINDQTLESSFVGQLKLGTNVPITTIYNADSPAPVVTRPQDDSIAFSPLADTQPLTEGLWLVRLELEGAFLTSLPQSDFNWGVLNVTLEFADDDGAGMKTMTQENMALCAAFYTNELEPTAVLNKSTITFALAVTAEECLAANGFPRRRFICSRSTSGADWPGEQEIRFTSTSGIYEIHKESMFSVQRIR